MSSFLEELARNLPLDKFTYLDNYYTTRPEDELALRRQKGYFPYSYVDSHARYGEGRLPPQDTWTNIMKEGAVIMDKKNNMYG